MIGASKILTVSYGTFSCTLEGFDDSFGTMKAIAEYFRDLAEKDRYFGAEPPVPDANMLAHIAQNEINQPVEASVDGNDVVLKRTVDVETSEYTSESAPKHTTEMRVPVQVTETPNDEMNNDLDDESVAAKLKRIRAVVAQNENNVAADFIEDQHADSVQSNDPVDRISIQETALEPSAEPVPDQGVISVDEAQKDGVDLDDQAVLDAFSKMEAEDRNAGETIEPTAPPIAQETPKPNTDGQTAIEKILEAEIDANLDAEDDAVSDPVNELVIPELQSTPESDAPVKPVRPRIVKMKKDDYEAAKQNGTLDEAMQQASQKPVQTAQPILGSTSLSPEDEAELLNELTDLEQDMQADAPNTARAAEPAPESAAESAPEPAIVAKTNLHDTTDRDEAAVARLMTETDAQMEEPEGSRRRSAISHLKAAVAATVADRKLNPFSSKDTEDDSKPYRTDLADVVRPRRPKATGKGREAATPLVLVSEQRIDETQPRKPARTQPRRIAVEQTETPAAHAQSEQPNFSDFARKSGVTGMVDIMEAAAAFAQFSEGHPHVGRPHLMRMAADYIGKDGFSREEGLRAFGELLRQNKIIKIKRGRFAIAETTRFKPMSHVAVG